MNSSLKTILMLFVAALMMQCQAFAGDSGGGQKGQSQQVEEAAKDSTQTPTQFINTPDRLKGIVEVSFRIDTDGKVDIQEIKSNNPELIKYVAARLERIKLNPEEYQPGKTINYRFSFGRQA